jgi:hypothetical protein
MKKLNQLLNFTNNPDKDNWLDKYNWYEGWNFKDSRC